MGIKIAILKFAEAATVTYMTPKSSKEQKKLVCVFYAMVTPMLNPLIYSLRNKDVKGALRKVATRNFPCRLEICH